MESGLFENSAQIELMLKLDEYFRSLSPKELGKIMKEAEQHIDLSPEEQEIIIEECKRLREESEVRYLAEEHLKRSEEQLRKASLKPAYVEGFDVADPII